MQNINSLQNQLLIAMPMLADPNFSQAVVYICEYNENGAMGIVVNKPMDITLGEILRHLQIPVTNNSVDNYFILKGGPIAQEQGFILHRQRILNDGQHDNDDSASLDSEIVVSASKQDLVQLAEGQGLNDTVVSLGYAGWAAGQLERELADNAWLVVPNDPAIIFDTPFTQRWHRAAASIGIDFNRLSSDVGHA